MFILEVHWAIQASLQAFHLNLKKHVMQINLFDKNPNWREANQLVIYKNDRKDESGS